MDEKDNHKEGISVKTEMDLATLNKNDDEKSESGRFQPFFN